MYLWRVCARVVVCVSASVGLHVCVWECKALALTSAGAAPVSHSAMYTSFIQHLQAFCFPPLPFSLSAANTLPMLHCFLTSLFHICLFSSPAFYHCICSIFFCYAFVSFHNLIMCLCLFLFLCLQSLSFNFVLSFQFLSNINLPLICTSLYHLPTFISLCLFNSSLFFFTLPFYFSCFSITPFTCSRLSSPFFLYIKYSSLSIHFVFLLFVA